MPLGRSGSSIEMEIIEDEPDHLVKWKIQILKVFT